MQTNKKKREREKVAQKWTVFFHKGLKNSREQYSRGSSHFNILLQGSKRNLIFFKSKARDNFRYTKMEKESFEERRPMRYQIPEDKKKRGAGG